MAAHGAKIIPDLATSTEQGLPGVEASVWNAFFLPPKAPPAIVAKLNKAMSDTLDDPAIHTRLGDLGLEIAPPERRTPGYLAKFQAEEVARWSKVVHDAGISADAQ
jgi:tripartite-type tricarboxylate transporter receptor subunit TctC